MGDVSLRALLFKLIRSEVNEIRQSSNLPSLGKFVDWQLRRTE